MGALHMALLCLSFEYCMIMQLSLHVIDSTLSSLMLFPIRYSDLNAVIWLDDYLQRWKKTLLVVSHDQDFLNSVCQEIIHLESKKLVSYRGNYDSFKEQQAVRRKQLQKDWEKQEKKLRELKAKGATKDKAEKVQLKAKSREPGARSKKQEAAAAASGGLESGESQVKLIERPRDYQVSLERRLEQLFNLVMSVFIYLVRFCFR